MSVVAGVVVDTFIIVIAILCVILFFKVWGMTNDVRRLRELYEYRMDIEYPLVEGAGAKASDLLPGTDDVVDGMLKGSR